MNKVYHGLEFDVEKPSTDVADHTIRVKHSQRVISDQTFLEYYRQVFHSSPPPHLQVVKMFSYLFEISSQYTQLFGRTAWVPLRHIICVNRDIAKYWSLFGVHKSYELSELRQDCRKLMRSFSVIDLSNQNSLTQVDLERKFGTSYLELLNYNFFEAKDSFLFELFNDRISPDQIANQAQKVLSPRLGINFFSAKHPYFLFKPYTEARKRFPMNDEIAIYSITYYLSTLVRYRPDLVENFLEGKYKWLFDSFILSCPDKFLNAVVSRIVKRNVIMSTI